MNVQSEMGYYVSIIACMFIFLFNSCSIEKEKDNDTNGPPVTARIVYCSTIDGDQDIYIINTDGTGRRRLTDDGYNTDILWVP